MKIFNLFFKTIILFFLSLFKNRDKVYKKLIKHRVKENKILISKEDKFYLKNIFNIHFLE